MDKYNMDIDTLNIVKIQGDSQFTKGSLTRRFKGDDVSLVTEYNGWNSKTSSMDEAILNIKDGIELSGGAKRLLMVIAIYRVLEKSGITPLISANYICDKSTIPVMGFTGMYIYFKLGLRKDRVDTSYFTINHEIINNWQDATEKYKKMSSQLAKIPKLISNMNKEYKKIKAKVERMMFKNKIDAKMAVVNAKT